MGNTTYAVHIRNALDRTWAQPTFEALHNRNYRWLWLARLMASAGWQMAAVVQGWLVFELTGSAAALAWVSTASMAAMFFLSPYGGVLCDRVDKRLLLVWTRGGITVTALGLAILIALGIIQVWHIALAGLITGACHALMMPAQQTIISDMVPRESLLNAVSLNYISMGVMGIFAPSLSGLLIKVSGPQGVYFLMAAIYGLAIWAVMHLPKVDPEEVPHKSVWLDFREGLHHLRGQPLLITFLAIALAQVLFIMPYRAFMPKFSKDVMGFDATGLGLLMAAPGLGSLISSLVVASLGDYRGKGKLLLTTSIISGLMLSSLGLVRSFGPVMLALVLLGALTNATSVLDNTLVQSYSARAYRGRVMSVYMMMWGLNPVGTLPAGTLADLLGVQAVFVGQGLLMVLVLVTIGLVSRRLFRLD